MRSMPSRWITVGIPVLAVVALLVGISLSLWMVRTSNVPNMGVSGSPDSPVVQAAKEAGTANAAVSPSTDTVTVSDSVDVKVERAQVTTPETAGGGRGERLGVKDSVDFIVRDASGKAKQHGVIK